MGDANSGRTSKGKSVLGGLVGSLKRVAGGRKHEKEAAPRTGVSLRDRYSALEPSAAPTDPVPQKVSENIPDPDRKDVKVIHTSAVRSSGSARFSDRIGLSAASEAEEGYDRKITFDDGDSSVVEEMIEEPTFADEIPGADNDVVFEDIADAPEEEAPYEAPEADAMEEISETEVPAEEVVVEMPAEVTVTEERAAPKEAVAAETPIEVTVPEEKKAPIEEKKVTIEEKRAPSIKTVPIEEKRPVEEKKAPAPEKKQERAAEEPRTASSDDGFDEGYDFLPRRSVSDRFAGMERKAAARPSPKEEMRFSTPAEKSAEAKKETTALAERMKAKNAATAPKRTSEVQMDGPVQHVSMSRTSLLEKVTSKKASGKSVYEIIHETELRTEPKETPAAAIPDEIEECDADVSAAVLEAAAICRPVFDADDEVPVNEEVAADAECIGVEMPAVEEVVTEEEASDEIIPEAADIEVETEEFAEVAVEVVTEEEATEAAVEIEAEVPEAVIEIEVGEVTEAAIEAEAEEIPETVIEVEAEEVTETIIEAEVEVPEAVVEVEAERASPDHYLLEIENDTPCVETDMCADDAEECMLALLNGVAVDDGMIIAEVPVAHASEPAPAEAEFIGEALAMCFTFLSESSPSPSASVRFTWGQ